MKYLLNKQLLIYNSQAVGIIYISRNFGKKAVGYERDTLIQKNCAVTKNTLTNIVK
jgi:hypothetical protein